MAATTHSIEQLAKQEEIICLLSESLANANHAAATNHRPPAAPTTTVKTSVGVEMAKTNYKLVLLAAFDPITGLLIPTIQFPTLFTLNTPRYSRGRVEAGNYPYLP